MAALGTCWAPGTWAALVSDLTPVAPSGDWQQFSYLFIAKRPREANLNAGTANAKDGDQLFLAVDLTALLEAVPGGATVEAAACGITGGGATIGDLAVNGAGDVAGYNAGTMVGAMFSDFTPGFYTVAWQVVFTNNIKREIPCGLVVTA